jgi:uncharacterized lipoprotein NlpE involved in copper resistance
MLLTGSLGDEVGHLAESGEVDLGVDPRRSSCAVAQVVADLLDTQALSNEPCCTSVSQCVRSAVLRLDVQGLESVSY